MEYIEMGYDEIIDLAVSNWRIIKWNNHNKEDIKKNSMPLEYGTKKIKSILESKNVETIDLTGKYYDIGLAVDVVYNIDEDISAAERTIIQETISPIVFINNKVVKRGEVVIKNYQEEKQNDKND